MDTKVENGIVLEARQLNKTYAMRAGPNLRADIKRIVALQNASVKVRRGTTVGLVGESGSGKSTLGRCLTLLERPDSGEVLLEGESLSSASARRVRMLRKQFQTVFQDPYSSLNPRKTIGRLIREPLDIHRMGTPEERRRRAVELMEVVGLRSDQYDRYPHELSGGQRQRVAIGRALAPKPQLLILDEPTSALDVSIQAQIVNLLLDLQQDFDLTYVFISHDLNLVRHICDDVYVMRAGEIVESGSMAKVMSEPEHDYTRSLLAATPRL